MLNQKLQQKLLQKLSPQQIQLIKLLEIPSIELEQRIKKELEENPMLEEGAEEEEVVQDEDEAFDDDLFNDDDDVPEKEAGPSDDEFSLNDYIADDDDIPYYNLKSNNASKDDERREIPFSSGSTFHESLLSQAGLRFLDEKHRILVEFIIGNLDEDGYLRREISAMVDDLSFQQNINATEEEFSKALLVVQDMDPPGTGARNLRECLLLQLKKKEKTNKASLVAISIITNCFEEFTKKHYDKIIKKLNISEEDLKDAISEVLRLNPKPGSALSENNQKNMLQVSPDFAIENIEGQLYVSLNSHNSPELRISTAYRNMLQESKTNKEIQTFVKQKIDSANWFIDALKQRKNTLMLVMSSILQYQEDFFREGDDVFMRPMILKDISEKTGLDISTISRVVNSKYVQTQHGIFPLKYFFSESMQNDSGEEVSTREIKKIMMDIIDAEDKRNPLTDEELAEKLKEKGYPIARRTIAKYREQIGIQVGRLRKEL
ncbi:MAG: RNA polymerase sigma-54 factor [Bacteroidetes bacterium HGW-Bacteroidetes-21]|jgi:RNA polymerase sigma-54 factor|nr:MAG: RNA polymerase sigma-54 factor [Bacteroidetes bacterium HGW-Bacteroidetes-21]